MGWLLLLCALLLSLACTSVSRLVGPEQGLVTRQSPVDHSGEYTIPPGSPGFQHGNSSAAVTFDQHSLFIDDKRVLIFSGEVHPWRIPSGPALWEDVLQKMKAGGFNTVSIYVHWGISEGKQGRLNFEHHRSLAAFYDVCEKVGVYVIVRPGPYINAETSAGGFPGWLTNQAGKARTNASDFTEAWRPYIRQVAEITAPYQYPDGPVIAVQSENEFKQNVLVQSEHMVLIIEELRAGGITKVPITHNDQNPAGNFASGLGEVDLYGWDAYPVGFDCRNPSVWANLRVNSDEVHQRYNPAEPLYLGEYQGGAFDPWAGPGYDMCYQLVNEQFANVFYKNNYASGATLHSLYMLYGGTNWGNLATPTVYTSYDYGAPIREDRTLSKKYLEVKLHGLFLQASTEFLTAVRIGNGTVGSGTAYSNSSRIYTTHLWSPGQDTNFYFVREINNGFTDPVNFSLRVNTTAGQVTIPQYGSQITLAGRESKIIVTNYKFGSSTLTYSTAEVSTWATIDGTDFIVLYALAGQSIEAVLPLSATEQPSVLSNSGDLTAEAVGANVVITGSPSGVSVIEFGKTKVIVADKDTAGASIWNPRLLVPGQPTYDSSPTAASVLVIGPYLVRSATLSDDATTLDISGDITESTTIDVFAPASVTSIRWNGEQVEIGESALGAKRVTVEFELGGVDAQIPNLNDATWLCADSLPEIANDFDDSDWVVADKTTTLRPLKPLNGSTVLYADEYGFHSGNFLFRGYFDGGATGVYLSVQGGYNFGFSAFLNGKFLGSNQGTAELQGAHDLTNDYFAFAPEDLRDENVLTVVMDSTGLEQDFNVLDTHKAPRGIRGYSLVGGSDFKLWKLTGNLGGEDGPDSVRGPINEGGLWVEREGAIFPGYPAEGWTSSATDPTCNPTVGISSAGIKAYRTTFDLDLPAGSDIPVALTLERTPTSNYRVMIYINGWQFGRFTSNFGPQTLYPLPEGILNHNGPNELLLTLWSLDAQGAKVAALELKKTAAIQSGKAVVEGGIIESPSFQELRG